jgi:hypothetical protein
MTSLTDSHAGGDWPSAAATDFAADWAEALTGTAGGGNVLYAAAMAQTPSTKVGSCQYRRGAVSVTIRASRRR